MRSQSVTNGLLVVLGILAVLVVARPAAGQSSAESRNEIKDELERLENTLERIVHDAGDSLERRTDIDVDLADNVERVFGKVEKEWRRAVRDADEAREDVADDLEHAVTEFLWGVHVVGEDLLDRLCQRIGERREDGEVRTCSADGTPGSRGGVDP